MMAINGFDADMLPSKSQMSRAMTAGYIAMGVYFTKNAIYEGMPDFIANCTALGFKMWLIDEGAGSKAVFARGAAGGNVDGKRAAQMAQNVGIPAGTPIFFGIDFNAQQSDVANIRDYLTGYQGACLPYKAGMYADGLVASQVPTAVGDYIPGASGWAGTAAYLKSGKVALIQHPPSEFLGMDADPVEIVDESVLWAPGQKAAVPTAEPPVAIGNVSENPQTDTQPENPMNPMPDLKAAQAFLGVTADGIYGPQTAMAIANYYS